MSGDLEIRLAEFLASRLCHELVSPIGAIANGLEILEDDPEFASDAAGLIGQSARQAARRLQFYRVAYGSVAEIGDALARQATLDLFDGSKLVCDWPETGLVIPAGWQKLACNLVLLASEALPRGGRLALMAPPSGTGLLLQATGAGARLAEGLAHLISGDATAEDLTPRSIQAVFTAALAARLTARVTASLNAAESVVFSVLQGSPR